MKKWCYLFYLFGFILFWQLILIFDAVYDVLIGIRITSIDTNNLHKTIPCIIHQMWKDDNLLTYPINTSHHQWKQIYPNCQINLWTDRKIEELLLKTEYRYLYATYKSYLYGIQRADLARLIILHYQGGIYVDLDVYSSYTTIDDLRLKGASLIIPRSSDDKCLINHFLMAEKHSHIIQYILNEIQPKSYLKQIYILPYLEVFSTGSIFLTNILRKRMKLIHPKADRLLILSNDQLSEYINHDAGRSWHLFDGFIINQIDAHPKLFFVLIFLIILCCIKFRRFFNRIILF